MSESGCGDPRCGVDYCRGSQTEIKNDSALTLRDRIAAVQRAHHFRRADGHESDWDRCSCGEWTEQVMKSEIENRELWELHVADAVIAELKEIRCWKCDNTVEVADDE